MIVIDELQKFASLICNFKNPNVVGFVQMFWNFVGSYSCNEVGGNMGLLVLEENKNVFLKFLKYFKILKEKRKIKQHTPINLHTKC